MLLDIAAYAANEISLGLGIAYAVIVVPLGKLEFQLTILAGYLRVASEYITKSQFFVFESNRHKMQVMSSHSLAVTLDAPGEIWRDILVSDRPPETIIALRLEDFGDQSLAAFFICDFNHHIHDRL